MSERALPSQADAGPRTHSAFWWHLSRLVVLGLCKVWFRLRVEGRQHVPATGPVLLVANHASYLDPPLVGITAGRFVRFLAQAGLAKFAPLRFWMRQVGVTLIDRAAPSKDALRLISDCLRGGDAVGVYPEGTRSRDGSVGPFRSGVEFLARRSQAVVVPVGIQGGSRAFPRGKLLPRPFRIVVRYGAPWTAEQVLAPGGLEALRRCVATLAQAPLAQGPLAPNADGTGSDGCGAVRLVDGRHAAPVGAEAQTSGPPGADTPMAGV